MTRGMPIPDAWRVTACVFALVACQSASAAVADHELEAAIIYKISKFVRWPDAVSRGGDTLKLCVVGRDEVGASIEELAGQKIHDQVIEVLKIPANGTEVLQCQILVIGRSEEANAAATVAYLARAPVLTISGIDGFAALGGIVGFVTHDRRITIQINPAAGRRAGLEIGAQLLQLATLVADAQTGTGP